MPGVDDIIIFDGTSDLGASFPADFTEIGGILVGPEYDGTITINSDLQVDGDIDLQSGSIHAAGHDLDVNGDVNVTGASLNVGSGSLSLEGDLVVDGTASLSINGALNFDGAEDQNLSLAGHSLHDVSVDKAGGTLALDGEIHIDGDFTVSAGTVEGGTSEVHFEGNGATITAGDSTFNDLVIDGGTMTLNGNLDVDGDLNIENAYYLNGAEIEVAGNIVTTDNTVYGSTVIVLDGDGDQLIGAEGESGELNNLRIEKDAGTTTIADTLLIGGDFTHVSGDVDATGTVEFKGNGSTISAPGMEFHDVVFDSGTLNIAGGIDVEGDLTIEAAYYINGDNIEVAGDITTTDTSVYGSATFVLDGEGDQVISANGASGELNNLTIDKAAGTTTIADTLLISGNFTHVEGDVDATGTVEFKGNGATISAPDMEFNDVVFDSGTLTIDGSIDVEGDLEIEKAYYINGGDIEVAGNITTTDTSVYGSATFVLDGTGDQLISAAGGSGELNNVTIDKAAGTTTIADTLLISGNFTHVDGDVDATGTVEFKGNGATINAPEMEFNDVTFDSGTLTIEGGVDVEGDLVIEKAYYINGDDIAVAGNITTTDTSVYGTATFVLDGAGDQTIGAEGGSGALNNVTIDKSAGATTISDTSVDQRQLHPCYRGC